MKKAIILTTVLFASIFSFGQSKQVVSKTPVSSSNPVKLKIVKDEYTDNVYLVPMTTLVITRDNKTGVKISPTFSEYNGKWSYDGMIVTSFIGSSCNENDDIYFLFDDGTKINYKSWQDFNCKNTSYFDRTGDINPLLKKIKGIKFVNGRSYKSYEMTLTNVADKNYFINVQKALDELNK